MALKSIYEGENENLPFEIDKGELVRTFIIPADTDVRIENL